MASARPASSDRSVGRRRLTAAGAVVLRRGRQVLLVHRPKYDDWSFPKGKLDRGEHVTAAAVREVEEETGLRVRLGRPLRSQTYPTSKGRKTVHYWIARTTAGDDVSGYVANDEIDEVAWVPIEKAAKLLSYRRDRRVLAQALENRKRTRTLIVLRHANARSRRRWHRDDRLRPLLAAGHRQAEQLSHVLAAYGVRRVVTSSSIRCVETVVPYCQATGLQPELVDVLSEEDARPRKVRKLVAAAVDLLQESGPTVLCTHRPVLPAVFGALGTDDPGLEKGELLVAHLRHGRVVAVERL
jgi:8-oxo-dGTP pyrophosphatase MutT (NUDIX family)/phosphohistidine phosphatase SixA